MASHIQQSFDQQYMQCLIEYSREQDSLKFYPGIQQVEMRLGGIM